MSRKKSELKVVAESPKAAPRSGEAINQEYSQLCTILGDKTIKRDAMDAELVAIKGRINDLAKEMSDSLAAAASEAVKA